MKCGAHLARTIIAPRCRRSASASTPSRSSMRSGPRSTRSLPRPVGTRKYRLKQTAPWAAAQSMSAGSSAALPGVAVVWTTKSRRCARSRSRDSIVRARAWRPPRKESCRSSSSESTLTATPETPACLQRRHPRLAERRPVAADHHRCAAAGRVRGEIRQVLARQRLAAAQDQHRRRVHGHQLVDHAAALAGRQLALRRFPGPGRDVAVSAGEIAAPRQVPGHDVRQERLPSRLALGRDEGALRDRGHGLRRPRPFRPTPSAAAPPPPASPRRASSSRSRPGTCPSSPRCRGSGSA